MEELIIVKQIPIIEENLKKISEEIDKKVEIAESLICTEDTVKEVKKTRTEISKQFKELESQRKQVKEKVMKPYNEFEDIYKKYISDKFKSADTTLKIKIDTVENELKENIKELCIFFFNEYSVSKGVEFLDFEKMNMNITLGLTTDKGQLTKKAKDEIATFIDKVFDEVALINTQEYSNEILIEYKKDLNVARAIKDVKDRYIQLQQIEEQKQAKKVQEMTDEAMLEKIESLTAPKVEEQEELCEMTFTVKGTLTKLKELKQYLIREGFINE